MSDINADEARRYGLRSYCWDCGEYWDGWSTDNPEGLPCRRCGSENTHHQTERLHLAAEVERLSAERDEAVRLLRWFLPSECPTCRGAGWVSDHHPDCYANGECMSYGCPVQAPCHDNEYHLAAALSDERDVSTGGGVMGKDSGEIVRPATASECRCRPPLYGATDWFDFGLKAGEDDLWRCPDCDKWWGIRWLWWRAGSPRVWEPMTHQKLRLRKRLRAASSATIQGPRR